MFVRKREREREREREGEGERKIEQERESKRESKRERGARIFCNSRVDDCSRVVRIAVHTGDVLGDRRKAHGLKARACVRVVFSNQAGA